MIKNLLNLIKYVNKQLDFLLISTFLIEFDHFQLNSKYFRSNLNSESNLLSELVLYRRDKFILRLKLDRQFESDFK